MSDTLPEWSYPDWLYRKVMACLASEAQRHPNGYTFYKDSGSNDFVAVWDNSEDVTLFYGYHDAVYLPPALADAVRHDTSEG